VRTEQGNQVRYQVHAGHPLYPELAGMFHKTHGIVPALRAALEPLGRKVSLALVFGSVARGAATARDVMDKPRLWVKGGEDDLAELAGHPAPAGA
jgi:hypothetical protein